MFTFCVRFWYETFFIKIPKWLPCFPLLVKDNAKWYRMNLLLKVSLRYLCGKLQAWCFLKERISWKFYLLCHFFQFRLSISSASVMIIYTFMKIIFYLGSQIYFMKLPKNSLKFLYNFLYIYDNLLLIVAYLT